MRILVLQKTTDAQGGSKASLRNTLQALSAEAGLDVEVCGEAPGALSEFAESLDIPFKIVPFPRWRNFADRLRFKKTIRRAADSLPSFDWIISNEMWWAPHAVELAKHCGALTAAIVRDEIADLKKARQYKFGDLDKVITVSEDLRVQFKDDVRLYERTRTIYNIVERPMAEAGSEAALAACCAACPKVERWVLSAGTLCPRKDQILLVKAVAELAKRNDQRTGILFVGGDSGGYEVQLKQAVHDSGLDARVIFAGQLPSIGAALDLAEVKVLTSHSEGLPRVLIESALAGLPSLSTRVSGVDEVYGTYADNFVMRSRDPVELANKLESLLNSRTSESIDAMKTRAETRFSKEAHLESWRHFLELE